MVVEGFTKEIPLYMEISDSSSVSRGPESQRGVREEVASDCPA